MAQPRRGVSVKLANGNTQEMPPEQVADALASGAATQINGPVKIVRGNEVRETTQDKLNEALAYGWEVTGDEGARDALEREEESGILGTARGTAEAFGSGLTFGLSDVVLGGHRGSEDRRRYQARAEAAGDAGEAARFVGEVAPVLLSGGGAAVARGSGALGKSALARGAGTALKGSGLAPLVVEGAGDLAERGAVRVLGSGLRGRAVGATLRGGVEGAAGAVGQEVRESVLGDRDITTERLLAAGGMGALMGGGVSVAFPLVGAAAGKAARVPMAATRKVLGAANKMSPDGSVIGSMAQTIASGKSAKAAREQLSMLGNKKSAAKLNRALHHQDEVAEEIGTRVRDSLDSFAAKQREIVRDFELDRSSNMGKLIDDAGDGATARMVQSDTETMLAKMGEHLEVVKNPDYKASFLQRPIDQAQARIAKLRDEVASGKVDAAGSYQKMLGGLRDLQSDIRKVERRAAKDPAAEASLEVLRDMESQFRAGLGSNKYGRAAEAFRDVSKTDAMAFATRKEVKGTAIGRLMDPEALSTNADALSVVKNHGEFKASDRIGSGVDLLDREVAAMRKRAEYSGSPEIKRKLGELETLRKKAAAAFDETAENAQILARQREMGRSPLSGVLAGFGPSGAAVTGAMLGGPSGAAVGAGLAALARPGQSIRTLSAIRSVADRIGVDVDGIVKSVTSPTKAARAIASRAGRKTAGVRKRATRAGKRVRGVASRATWQASRRKSQEERDASRRERADRARLLTNPEELQRALARDMFDLESAAPELAATASGKVAAAAAFLATKLPPEINDPVTGSRRIVDRGTQESFDRYYEAVSDPVATLRRLEAGTFTTEHAEAIREVWPAMYEDIRDKVMTEMQATADRGERIPFSRRMSLGILLQLPTDPSLVPDMHQRLRSLHDAATAEEEAQEAGQAPGPPPTGGERTRKTTLKSARNYTTPMGRIERHDV